MSSLWIEARSPYVGDAGGNLVAFQRMNGAFLRSITVAEEKAYAAISFGLPTSFLDRVFFVILFRHWINRVCLEVWTLNQLVC